MTTPDYQNNLGKTLIFLFQQVLQNLFNTNVEVEISTDLLLH